MALLEVKDLQVHFPIRGGLFSRQVGEVKAVDRVNLQLRPARPTVLSVNPVQAKQLPAGLLSALIRSQGAAFCSKVQIWLPKVHASRTMSAVMCK